MRRRPQLRLPTVKQTLPATLVCNFEQHNARPLLTFLRWESVFGDFNRNIPGKSSAGGLSLGFSTLLGERKNVMGP